jgi:hypothetical protein
VEDIKKGEVPVGQETKFGLESFFPGAKDNNFELVYRYLDKNQIKYVLLHTEMSKMLTIDKFQKAVQDVLLLEINCSPNDKIHMIYKKEGNFIDEEINYIKEKLVIKFDRPETLEISKELKKNETLNELSPFFKGNSIDELIEIAIIQFKNQKKIHLGFTETPCIIIEYQSIRYIREGGKPFELDDFYKDLSNATNKNLLEILTFIPELGAFSMENEPQKKPVSSLSNSRYCFHLKVSDDENRNEVYSIKFNGGATRDNDPEPKLEEELGKPMLLYDKLLQIGNIFSPYDEISFIKALVNELKIPTIDFRLTRNTTIEKVPWSFSFDNLDDKLNSAKKYYELEEKDSKLREKEKDLIKLRKDYSKLLAIIKPISETMQININDENLINTEINKLIKEKERLTSSNSQNNELLKKIDNKDFVADKKIDILENFISGLTSENRKLSEYKKDELEKKLMEFTESYKLVKNLVNLKDFRDKELPELTKLCGPLKDLVKDKVRKLEDSLMSYNQNLIIVDAIRSKLSDPKLRNVHIDNLEQLNSELLKFNLKIDIPVVGEQANPAKQKFIGYEQGGARGTISSVTSWGLVELKQDKPDGITIYKPEVKIYQ